MSKKTTSEKGVENLSDRLRNTLTIDEEDIGDNVNKPDSKEVDIGSPITPLRTRTRSGPATTTTSSSSSSSGSVSGWASAGPLLYTPRKSDSNPSSYSGEIPVESNENFRRGHTRSHSCGSQILSSSGTVNSPAANVHPAGNVCPSGITTGMATRQTKPEVLGSGSGNYGHDSIMRGGLASSSDSDSGSVNYPRGLMDGGQSAKKMGSRSSNDSEELKRMGNECYKNGNFDEALILYDKAIAISPNNAVYYSVELKRMGNESYKNGSFAEALILYEKAIKIWPNNAVYHFNRATALMGMKLLLEAVGEYEEAIRLDPGYVRAHQKLGSLLLRLGRVEEARKHICLSGCQPHCKELQKLQLVEKHLSNCSDAWRVGDWSTTLREVIGAFMSGADASPQLRACRAEALLNLDRVEDAFFTLSESEPSTSHNSHLKIFGMLFESYTLFVRAQVELAKGRFDHAITSIEKAGQMDPHNTDVSNLLNKVKLVCRARARGNDLFKSDRFTEAISAYGEGLRLDPSNSILYCNRAACWFKLSNWERSVDDCNQALRIQPNYHKALLRRASSNFKLERWREAVRDYEALRRELPDDNEVAEALFHATVALKKSRGEEVYNMKFGGEVESVSGLEQFRAAILSTGVSVVHFKLASNSQCKQISPFVDVLCNRYPAINFLQVDIEESPDIARAENIVIVPTFKIFKKGSRVKEMVCPSPEVLESSVRCYNTI